MLATSDSDTLKAVLRAEARSRRRAVSPSKRDEAAAALLRHDVGFLGTPGILGAYHPIRSEIDGLPLARHLAACGWLLALPVINEGGPLSFHLWEPEIPLIAGPFGIPQPDGTPGVFPTAILVPLLAFDIQGHRLGYGGGHYDRTLEALRRDGTVTAIGLAFDEQEMAQLPTGPHDQRLDVILTPSGARRLEEQA